MILMKTIKKNMTVLKTKILDQLKLMVKTYQPRYLILTKKKLINSYYLFLNLKYKENKIRPTRTIPTNILKY